MKHAAVMLLSVFLFQAAPGCGEKKTIQRASGFTPSAHIDDNAGLEISGIAKSSRFPDIYWAVNDSGNPPVIVPFRKNGRVIGNPAKGILVTGAQNIDWESLAADSSGNLYICDTGNNTDRRKELQIYRIPEPSPRSRTTLKADKIRIQYPEDTTVSPDMLVHDCEAVFHYKSKLYFLTKRRYDLATVLYRLDSTHDDRVNTLTFLSRYEIGGYVTGADISPDQRCLAVLTYNALWLFYDFPDDDFFEGKKTRFPLEGTGQIESVVFTDHDEIMFINEGENELFTIPLKSIQTGQHAESGKCSAR